ncbi:MAG: hypothetical protein K0041_07670 [Acidithiobacillus sp.]|nr:hypothetical protein [Acidithiobacillus sp.]
MQKINLEKAVERAKSLPVHSALDQAVIAVAEQILDHGDLDLNKAVEVINNNQILEYAAFLYESLRSQELEKDCVENPPSLESEREWSLQEDQICLARAIAQAAVKIEVANNGSPS